VRDRALFFSFYLFTLSKKRRRAVRERERKRTAQAEPPRLPDQSPFVIEDEESAKAEGTLDSSDEEEEEKEKQEADTARLLKGGTSETAPDRWDKWELAALVCLLVYVPLSIFCVGVLLLLYPSYDANAKEAGGIASWLGIVLLLLSALLTALLCVHCAYARMTTAKTPPGDPEKARCCIGYECITTLSVSMWLQ
jgi:hypothetical protein